MKRLFCTLVLALFLQTSAWALIGTPCDPESDFTEVFFVRNWKNLPHKNQEETSDRCDEVNSKQSLIAWKYDPTPNTPLYACLSYGASTMADWWALELGWKLQTYRSYTNGSTETGFNPRKLELRYRKRGKWNLIQYYMARTDKDPITKEKVPLRPSGYARILVDRGRESIVDPIDQISFSYEPTDYPMDEEWFWVVSKNWNRDNVEERLIKALKDFGPMFVQFEIPGKHFLMGTHAPVVVGWGKLPEGKTVFIVHDSFGNFPKEHVQDGLGASAYRYVSADEIDEAIVFPHKLYAKPVTMQKGIGVTFVNRGGRAVPLRRAFFASPDGKTVPMNLLKADTAFIPAGAKLSGTVKVYVEADYYMKKGETGRWLTIKVP